MVLALLKYGLRRDYKPRPDFRYTPELKPSYDVVIVGAGGHGLATAYYLAKDWGIKRVCVIDRGYIGGGNTARNTAVIRSNYITPKSVRFYKESVKLFQGLSQELDFNIMYTQRGQLTLAHTDATMRTFRMRAEVGKHLGTGIEMVDRQQILEHRAPAAHSRGPPLSGDRRPLASRRRHRPPRRGRLGLRGARDGARRRGAPAHRGHRRHRRKATAASASRPTAARSAPAT